MVYNNNRYDLKVTWNNTWIGEFESPWSIFEKFKYANAATAKDIFNIFGTPEVRELKTTPGRYLSNLLHLKGIDDKAVKFYLDFSLKETQNKYLNNISHHLLQDRDGYSKFFNTHLVYCKKCISIGYHSLLHQFLLLNRCPYHLDTLLNRCLNCNNHIPFLLSDQYTTHPFKCGCGYMFTENDYKNTNFSLWKGVKALKIIDPLTIRWLRLNNEPGRRHSKIYFFENLYIKHEQRILENLLTVLEQDSLKPMNHYSRVQIKSSSPSYNKLSFPLDKEIRDEIYISTNQSYKSIIRYLKNTILLKHKTCIARLKKMAPDYEICPYAHAFLHWRKKIEGINNYWDVENGLRLRNRAQFNIEYASKQDTHYLNLLIDSFLKNYAVFIDQQQLITIINKVMCIFILNHFHNYLKYSKDFSHAKLISNTIPSGYEELPFFLIELNQKNNENFNFFFWSFLSNEHDKVNNEIRCPFSTVILRRNPRRFKNSPSIIKI